MAFSMRFNPIQTSHGSPCPILNSGRSSPFDLLLRSASPLMFGYGETGGSPASSVKSTPSNSRCPTPVLELTSTSALNARKRACPPETPRRKTTITKKQKSENQDAKIDAFFKPTPIKTSRHDVKQKGPATELPSSTDQSPPQIFGRASVGVSVAKPAMPPTPRKVKRASIDAGCSSLQFSPEFPPPAAPVRPLARRIDVLVNPTRNQQNKAPVKRALFGPVDTAALRTFLDTELEKISQKKKQRWNFDFENDMPLDDVNGNKWETITDVPSVYVGGCSRDDLSSEQKHAPAVNTAVGVEDLSLKLHRRRTRIDDFFTQSKNMYNVFANTKA
eukprot:Colp12_sorted_trinity150504_noHs@26104